MKLFDNFGHYKPSWNRDMGLEQLNTLFRVINVTGFLPVRILVDEEKNRFKHFNCGWHIPATWWFILLFILQLAWAPITTYLYYDLQVESTHESQESFVYTIVILMWHLSNMIVKLSPCLLVFHTSKLKKAFKALMKVDRGLSKISQKLCKSKRRTVLSGSVSLTGVSVYIGLFQSFFFCY